MKRLLLSCLQNLYSLFNFDFVRCSTEYPSPSCDLYFVYRNERSLEKYKDVHIQFSPLQVTESFDISGYEEEQTCCELCVCVGGGKL